MAARLSCVEMDKPQRGSGSKRAGSSQSSKKVSSKKRRLAAAEETGFDIMSQKIADGIYRLAGIQDDKQQSPEKIARSLQSNAPRKIRNNFQGAIGKAKTALSTPSDTMSSATSKRTRSNSSNRSVSMQQQSMQTATKTPSAVDHGSESKVGKIGFSFADKDTDVVEQHEELKHSTRTLMYKRLFPDEIVRLDVEDEIIIQVPAEVIPRMEAKEKSDLKSLLNKLDKAMLGLYFRLEDFEREEQLKAEHNKNNVDVLAKPYFEFPCRIKAYGERTHLANPQPDKSAINGFWNHGSGFYVELCGYSPAFRILIMHRSLPFVRVFKMRSGSILNDASLSFAEKVNPNSLAVPLSQKLALTDGDAMKRYE